MDPLSRTRSPRLVPLLVGVLAVAPAALAFGALAMGMDEHIAWPVGVCTALLSTGLAWISARYSSTKNGATVAALLGGIVAGIVNTPLSYLAVAGLDSAPPVFDSLLADAIFATVLGSVFAGPMGLLFGALYIAPIRAAHVMSRTRSVEAMDRLLLTVGIWLAAAGVLTAVTALVEVEVATRGATPVFAQVLALAALLGFSGAALAAAAGARMISRRSWLEAVREGKVPGWVVTRADGSLPWEAVLPSLYVTSKYFDGLVARRESSPGAGAYRTGERLVPWAVVDLPQD